MSLAGVASLVPLLVILGSVDSKNESLKYIMRLSNKEECSVMFEYIDEFVFHSVTLISERQIAVEN